MPADVFIYAFFIFLTLLTLVGGLMSLGWEKFYRSKNPNLSKELFHKAIWSKDLKIKPNHPDCKQCDDEVTRIEDVRDRRTKARRS